MPIKVEKNLPAIEKLAEENIFVMDENRAASQDIRPLKIIIVNLMPTKKSTETQFLRLLGNTALQVDVTFLRMANHKAKNTSDEHLTTFYKTFEDVRDDYFDGMIITGAPVENLEFEAVGYWEELVKIMDWSEERVFSTLHVCWGAQAALYHHYGISKYKLEKKLFGVFEHRIQESQTMLLRGFDDLFYMPHSRHTDIHESDIEKIADLEILVTSDQAGVAVLRSRDNKFVFVTGHAEYDPDTLEKEYQRDISQGKSITVPVNYYPDDDPKNEPIVRWRGHANLLLTNWLNYYVYQETPFDLEKIKGFKQRYQKS